jgi:hypothetical protein
MTGRCLCGKVSFEVDGPFERITQCHCTSCKKTSGGVGTASGRARSDAIRILEGRELLHIFQADEGSAKTFCSECGSNLFGGGWPETEFCSVRLTTLEPPFEGKVSAHIYVRSLAPWETLPDDGAERFEGPYGE